MSFCPFGDANAEIGTVFIVLTSGLRKLYATMTIRGEEV